MGFLKSDFCFAEELLASQKFITKKVINIYNAFFSLRNITFSFFSHIISHKTTKIEHLNVTALLEYFSFDKIYFQ